MHGLPATAAVSAVDQHHVQTTIKHTLPPAAFSMEVKLLLMCLCNAATLIVITVIADVVLPQDLWQRWAMSFAFTLQAFCCALMSVVISSELRSAIRQLFVCL